VLLGGPDRAVQLVRDRGHDACAAAGLRLRRHHGGHGRPGGRATCCQRVLGGDRGLGRGTDQGHLAGHPGEFGLHRRELCQRPAELFAFLHVRHGHVERSLGGPRDEQRPEQAQQAPGVVRRAGWRVAHLDVRAQPDLVPRLAGQVPARPDSFGRRDDG
jgi:hypothetical protein